MVVVAVVVAAAAAAGVDSKLHLVEGMPSVASLPAELHGRQPAAQHKDYMASLRGIVAGGERQDVLDDTLVGSGAGAVDRKPPVVGRIQHLRVARLPWVVHVLLWLVVVLVLALFLDSHLGHFLVRYQLRPVAAVAVAVAVAELVDYIATCFMKLYPSS